MPGRRSRRRGSETTRDRLPEDLVQFPVECAEIAQIVVTAPLDPDQSVRREDQPLQPDAVIERNDVVLRAVKEIDGTGDLPDPAVVSQRISQEHREDRSGQERVMMGCQIDEAQEGRLQNEHQGLLRSGDEGRDTRSESIT